jgi:hypothetical protein
MPGRFFGGIKEQNTGVRGKNFGKLVKYRRKTGDILSFVGIFWEIDKLKKSHK